MNSIWSAKYLEKVAPILSPKNKNPKYVEYKGFLVAGTGLEPVTFGL